MNEKVTQIIEELISLDPEFKKYQQELPNIINNLIILKPNITIDHDFTEKLKNQLITQIIEKPQNKKTNFNFMKKINYGLLALAFVLLLSLPLWIYQKNNSQPNTIVKNNEATQIAKLGREAFGSLSSNASSDSAMALPTSAGGGGASIGQMMGEKIVTTNEDGDIGRNDLITPDSMPYYQPTYYHYVYQGDDFDLTDQELDVLKRIKGQDGSANFANLNLDLLNLNSFDNSGLNSFTINQDKKFGYSIYVNIKEGMISLSENWDKWYDKNYVYREMRNTDLPSDASLIEISDKFLAEHQIDKNIYGPAEVQKNWYNALPMEAGASSDPAVSQIYPVPSNISILYPLLIDGKQIYDDWGNKQGLQLNINLEYKKVSSLYNLTTQQYQSSSYKMETDKEKIMKILEAGGIYNGYNAPETNAKIIDVAVGSPKIEYVKIWQYQNNTSDELLVPALVFPILDTQRVAELYKTQVVIPLAMDIINRAQDPGPIRTLEVQDK